MPRTKDGSRLGTALEKVSGKWKALILTALGERTLRFGELERRVPHASRKVLVQQLRALEADGLLLRIAYDQVPPRVEYSLTDRGRKLVPILRALELWGANAGAVRPCPAPPEDQDGCRVIPLPVAINPG